MITVKITLLKKNNITLYETNPVKLFKSFLNNLTVIIAYKLYHVY